MHNAHHGGIGKLGYSPDPNSGLTSSEDRAAWFLSMAQRKNEDATLGEQIAMLALAGSSTTPDARAADLRTAASAVAGQHDVPVDREVKLGFIRKLAHSEGGLKPRQRVGLEGEGPTPEAIAIATVLKTMSAKDRAMVLKQVPENDRVYFQALIASSVEQRRRYIPAALRAEPDGA